MPTAEFYRQKAEECVAAAKMATLNEERVRQYALAEHYIRLAMDEFHQQIKAVQSSFSHLEPSHAQRNDRTEEGRHALRVPRRQG
jgi:hypothetical protein